MMSFLTREKRVSPRTILVGGVDSTNAVGVLLLVLCLFTWFNSVVTDASNALRLISAVSFFLFIGFVLICAICTHM